MCGALAEPPHLPPATGEQVHGRRADAPAADALEVHSAGRRAYEVDVLVLTPADWLPLKNVRLRALQDSPHAFASAYHYEARWSEDDWRSTFDASLWLAARARHGLIGLARSTRGDRVWQRNIESVWVQPDRRRRGVTRLMLQRLIEHEPDGVTELYAWVLDGNEAARRVYQRLGFVFTGERQPLPGSVGRMEERFVLRLGRDRARG
jgi:L-amino acid N-acyltransferase YncA